MCCGKRICHYLLPIILLLFIVWSYYLYVFEFCVYMIDNPTTKCLYIFVYNILFFMMIWSCLHTMCQPQVPVPDQYRLSTVEHNNLLNEADEKVHAILKVIISTRKLNINTTNSYGYIKYCNACHLLKPDRTHHCKECGTCVLRMDHHCPWISTCVGFSNYKAFILLMLYGSLYCLFYIGTLMQIFVNFWNDLKNNMEKLHTLLGFFAIFVMGIVMSSLFFYNLRLMLRNETAIESIQGVYFVNESLTFDLGVQENFVEIFGSNFLLWLMPIASSPGNGYNFKTRIII